MHTPGSWNILSPWRLSEAPISHALSGFSLHFSSPGLASHAWIHPMLVLQADSTTVLASEGQPCSYGSQWFCSYDKCLYIVSGCLWHLFKSKQRGCDITALTFSVLSNLPPHSCHQDLLLVPLDWWVKPRLGLLELPFEWLQWNSRRSFLRQSRCVSSLGPHGPTAWAWNRMTGWAACRRVKCSQIFILFCWLYPGSLQFILFSSSVTWINSVPSP